MTNWTHTQDDGGEEYELIVPGEALYMLTPAHGERVNAEGGNHDDVEWFVDYSKMEDGGRITSKRFVTTEPLDPDAAKTWALKVCDDFDYA